MPRKELLVSLDVVSQSLTLAALNERFGIRADATISHEKGAPHPSGDVWRSTIWRLASRLSKTASLDQHVRELARRVGRARSRIARAKLAKPVLNVAIQAAFFDSTIELSRRALEFCNDLGATVDVTFYAELETPKGPHVRRKRSRP